MSTKFSIFLSFLITSLLVGGVYYFDNYPAVISLSTVTVILGLVVIGVASLQKNLFFSLNPSHVMGFLARTGYYNDVIDYLLHCIFTGIFLVIVGIMGLFLVDSLFWIWLYSLIFLTVLILILLCRQELLMRLIVKRFLGERYEG